MGQFISRLAKGGARSVSQEPRSTAGGQEGGVFLSQVISRLSKGGSGDKEKTLLRDACSFGSSCPGHDHHSDATGVCICACVCGCPGVWSERVTLGRLVRESFVFFCFGMIYI